MQNKKDPEGITPEPQDDEVSLLDLLAVMWKRKRLIISITVIAMVFIVIFSIISLVLPPEKSFLPNEYTPQAHMLINDNSSQSNSLSSLISSSGLGGLASLAGISTSAESSNSALAGFITSSNTFLDAVINEFDLINRYKIKKNPKAESRKALKKVLVSSSDDETGVFTISFTDIDPVFAAEVVNFSVDYMEKIFENIGLDKNLLEKKNLEDNIESSYNEILRLQKEIHKLEQSVSSVTSVRDIPSITLDTEMLRLEVKAQETVYTQLKAQYEILKVTLASERPVFQILERAEVPDQKSGPSRGMLCIIVTFAAGFFSVFLVFLLNAIDNIKKDPQAMAKLRGEKQC